MRTMKMFSMSVLMLLALPGQAALKVHEWGTFTSLVGSDGLTQAGLYHEDEKLPDFVHPFGATNSTVPDFAPIAWNPGRGTPPNPPDDCVRPSKICLADAILERSAISQKMETPVVYFYSDQPTQVRVNVRFPEGVITQTFPAPITTSPLKHNVTRLENGNTTFIVQTHPTKFSPPEVPAGNIYGHARNVKSDPIRSLGRQQTEDEHFIFYRGLGRFQPRLSITSTGGSLKIEPLSAMDKPQAAFLVYVNEYGQGTMSSLDGLKDPKTGVISEETLELFKENSFGRSQRNSMRGHLIKNLVGAGLNLDEAVAMVDTWEHGYLKVPGLRLLYILPTMEVDYILPMEIEPYPDRLVRVFVGRIEILTDLEETQLLNQILQKREKFNVAGLGRFAEAKLRRLNQVLTARAPSWENRYLMDDLIQRAKNGEGGVLN